METTDIVERALKAFGNTHLVGDGSYIRRAVTAALEAAGVPALQARAEKLRCLICENEASQCPTCEAAARNELTALVERLREGVWGKNPLSGSMPASQAMLKAADTITALQARVEKLEERIRILVWNGEKGEGNSDDGAMQASEEELAALAGGERGRCPRAIPPLRYCSDCDDSFPCQLPGRAALTEDYCGIVEVNEGDFKAEGEGG